MLNMMELRSVSSVAVLVVVVFSAAAMETAVAAGGQFQNTITCTKRNSPCYRRFIKCPPQCPYTKPKNPKAKACFIDCSSPKCEAVCRVRSPSCNGHGSGCYDPRFIGGDGTVFYFHGAKDESFALVSDRTVQINAKFIGLRPVNRSRDFTWIQALGFLFSSNTFTVSAIHATNWNDSVDHFRFTFNDESVLLPEGHLSAWKSEDNKISVERTGARNAAIVTLEGVVEASVKVVPITSEDDKVHGYGIPEDDCFAHLEVQFRFFGLSETVEGVLGRTYRPDYRSTAKSGVDMPVIGGESEYKTSELVAADCKNCLFAPVEDM